MTHPWGADFHCGPPKATGDFRSLRAGVADLGEEAFKM